MEKAIVLATKIYEITKTFPQSELYGSTKQMRCCSVSIPSNIAEGFCRGGKSEFRQIVHIAFGSGAEPETQLTIAKSVEFLHETGVTDIMIKLDEIVRMLNQLITSLTTNRQLLTYYERYTFFRHPSACDCSKTL